VFLKQAHIFGTHRLLALYKRSIDGDSAYDFPQLLRLLLEQGIHEPSQSARQRIVETCGNIEYWGEALEPIGWRSDDLACEGKRLVFSLELFESMLETDYSFEDLLAYCPHLDSIPTLDERFSTAFRTDAILATYSAGARGFDSPLSQVSYEPQNEFLSLQFPPEGQHREYKATFRFDAKSGQKNPNQQFACLKSIAGLMNAGGGTLVIGISDDLQVIGLSGDFSLLKADSKQDSFSQVIHEAIKTNLSPIPIGLASIIFRPSGLETICLVVCKPSALPIFIKSTNAEPELFVRDGNRTLKLNPEQTADFLQSKRIHSSL